MWDENWLQQFPQVKFRAGMPILRVGQTVRFAYYLEGGMCAKSVYSEDGDELIISYYHPGAMLGLHLRRYGRESCVSFIAKTACTCRPVPVELAEAQLRQDGALCYDVLQETLDELDFEIDSTIAHVFGGGISVLCSYLKMWARPQPDGTFLVPSIYTNSELSRVCGVHAVSISRMLGQLHDAGVLAREKDGIRILDMPALEAHIKLDA